jgi:hypothetical protein
VGGEKKNPARENSRIDKSLCDGTSLVAVHLAKVADQFQENIEIMAFLLNGDGNFHLPVRYHFQSLKPDGS